MRSLGRKEKAPTTLASGGANSQTTKDKATALPIPQPETGCNQQSSDFPHLFVGLQRKGKAQSVNLVGAQAEAMREILMPGGACTATTRIDNLEAIVEELRTQKSVYIMDVAILWNGRKHTRYWVPSKVHWVLEVRHV